MAENWLFASQLLHSKWWPSVLFQIKQIYGENTKKILQCAWLSYITLHFYVKYIAVLCVWFFGAFLNQQLGVVVRCVLYMATLWSRQLSSMTITNCGRDEVEVAVETWIYNLLVRFSGIMFALLREIVFVLTTSDHKWEACSKHAHNCGCKCFEY